MEVYTDSPSFAEGLLSWEVARRLALLAGPPENASALTGTLFREGPLWHGPWNGGPWAGLFLAEFSAGSQYDDLIALARRPRGLPDRVATVAGSGLGFHGFKGRSWAAVPGNLHLCVHLAPRRPVERFDVAFTVLAALSVVDAVDTVPELRGRAGIKWVNDVLVDGAKVAGILAYTQAREATVHSVVLGIGVNVETTPIVARTPFAPAVACLRDFAHPRAEGHQDPVSTGALLEGLLESLDRNYRVLLSEGFGPLLERYRERSLVVGREVTIRSEGPDLEASVLAEGRVRALGEGLELYLEGRPEPVRGGRLLLEERVASAAAAHSGHSTDHTA